MHIYSWIGIWIDVLALSQLTPSTWTHNRNKWCQKFPKKYKTKIGERGVQLSGGQKQRISIARAFYTKPEIYILDDCLSAVDSITERKIVKNLNKLSSKTTSIVVSHRIMSLVKCDNIIVLDEGKIIESGTHTDLIKKNGFYFRMFTNQVQNKTNIL